MQTQAKASVRKRLQRIEGQVRGLARMVEQDRYCIDVVTQISAVRAALRAVEMKSCAITSTTASRMPSLAATRPSNGARWPS
jgi:DNA-binding FrmR family transcriptional regulator